MINEFLEKIMLENTELEKQITERNLSNNISSVLHKIKNSEELNESELATFKSIISIDKELNYVEMETIGFIEFLISINEHLDTYQLELINKLLNKYKNQDMAEINNILEKNKRLIESLKSNNLFADYDYLLEMLRKYNYSNKEILIILKGLIESNYKDYDKSNIKYKEEVTIEIETEKTLDKQLINKLKRLLKKYQISSYLLDEKLLRFLPIEDNMFKDSEYILNFLSENKIDIKRVFKKTPLDLLFTLAFAPKENVIKIKEICTENNIDIAKLLNYNVVIFNNTRTAEIKGTIEYFGLYENFVANVELLNSIGYKHSENVSVKVYYMANQLCKNCYDLFKNEYDMKLNSPQDIEMIFTHFFGNCVDRTLELPNGNVLLKEDYKKFLVGINNKCYYQMKKQSRNYNLISSNSIPTFELTKLDKEYSKLFASYIDLEGDIFVSVPLEYTLDHTLEENGYVKYLENTFKKDKYIYLLNETTRISRIKVLRVLNYLNKHGIEIGKEEVKFAMKFDFIGYSVDMENIENVFKDYKKGGTKKLC